MIFLTAPLDMQQTPAYDSALAMLRERHGTDAIAPDRDLFEDMAEYVARYKEVYDPAHATALYVLAREDGTIGSGVYRQYRRLSKHSVPAELLFPDGEQAAEVGYFTVTLIDKDERTNRVYAVVNPDPSAGASAEATAEATAEASDGRQNKERSL